MRRRDHGKRSLLGFEAMEGRIALSGIGGLDDGAGTMPTTRPRSAT